MGPVPGESRDRHPHDEDHDLENVSGDVIIPADLSVSGSEDEEANDNQGYMPLPQDYQELDDDSSTDEDDNNDGGDHREASDAAQTEAAGSTPATSVHSATAPGKALSYMQVPDLPRPTESDLLWNQPRQERTFIMDDDQVAQVKAAMSGFLLPDSSVPGWARSVSEDAWKHQLLSRLQPSSSSAAKAVSQSSQGSASAPCRENANRHQDK